MVASHLAVVSHMTYLNEESVDAFEHAKGWKQRLRWAKGNLLVLTEECRFPVTRTVCSDRVSITGPSSMLDIPTLEETKYWRTKNVAYSTGTSKQVNFASLGLQDWDALRYHTVSCQVAPSTPRTWIRQRLADTAGSKSQIGLCILLRCRCAMGNRSNHDECPVDHVVLGITSRQAGI